MAIICVKVPDGIAKSLSRASVPGEHVPDDQKHITLLYVGENLSIEEIGKVVIAIARVTEKESAFDVRVNRHTCFPQGSAGTYPVICPVEGSGIHRIHHTLKQAFDAAEIDYDRKFPEFKPHVTLAYSPDNIPNAVLKSPLTWTVTELTLWTGNEGDERVCTTFELMGQSHISVI